MFLRSRTRVFSRDQRGSLLIEVLVSVVILSTALTLIIQSMIASARAIQYGAGYTTALVLLDNQISEMSRKKMARSGLMETKDLAWPAGTSDVYRYSMRTGPWDDAADQAISQLDASVTWRSGRKDNQIVVTTFLFAASNE